MAYDKLSLSFADAYGRETKRIVEVATEDTRAEMVAAAAAFSTLLEAVTDLRLVRADWIVQAVDTGFAVTPGANVDVGGTVSGYLADGNGKKGSLKIPGIKASMVKANGELDLTDEDLAAFLAQFESEGDCYISDGESVDTWIKGVLDK
jgi:hypothetical protein